MAERPSTPGDAAREHLGPVESHQGWVHARSLGGAQPLTVYTRVAGKRLGVRVDAFAQAGAAELTSLLYEVSLLPRWNRYCDGAEVLHTRSTTDLTAATGVRLPWPVPAQFLAARAQLARDPRGGVAAMAWPAEGVADLPRHARPLPAAWRSRHVLPFELAVGRLRAHQGEGGGEGGGGGAGTKIEAVVSFDLSKGHLAAVPPLV